MSAVQPQPRPRSQTAAPPLRIGEVMLALGDSIAAGIGASHASEGCMALLAAHLAILAPGLTLHNLAVPGATSGSMLAPGGQLERAEALVARCAAAGQRCAPVLLSIGGNDVMEAPGDDPEGAVDGLAANLDLLFRRLRLALAADGVPLAEAVCLQTVYNPFEAAGPMAGNGASPPGAHPRLPRRNVNVVLREVAAAYGVRVAEVSRAFRGRAAELTWVGSGDIHPNDAGHRAIARAYAVAAGWLEP